MAEAFLGEIRMVGFNYAPNGWAFCNGQLVPISQNTALFSILGTTYGGNGTVIFALPNLAGRAPMHFGQGPGLSPRDLGEEGGEQTVTLNINQMPQHAHPLQGSTVVGNNVSPNGNTPAVAPGRGNNAYTSATTPVAAMNQTAIGAIGGSGPHNNMQPYQAVNFCICLNGIFPPRS